MTKLVTRSQTSTVTLISKRGPLCSLYSPCMVYYLASCVFLFGYNRNNAWLRDTVSPLQWRHNEHDGVSNHQPHDCLLNRLFGRRSKKPSNLRVTGLCTDNSPVTSEFPTQRASDAENVSIWWRHHAATRRDISHRCAGQHWRLTSLVMFRWHYRVNHAVFLYPAQACQWFKQK